MDNENIYYELQMLGISKAKVTDIEEIRNKAGIYLYRIEYDNNFYVLKYFENEDYRREIENYRVLKWLEVPTVKVIGFTDKSILLEDINKSDEYRLGVKEDLSDTERAKVLAKWYIKLHEQGARYIASGQGKSFYRETDCITTENIEMVKRNTNTEDNEVWNLILSNFDLIIDKISSGEETLTYNDFYWTNLAVGRDGKKAAMFDYNFLGIGFKYNDIRNVCSSLSKEAGKAFTEAYGTIDEREKVIDEGISILINLIFACRKPELPDWAQESIDDIHSGRLKAVFERILEL